MAVYSNILHENDFAYSSELKDVDVDTLVDADEVEAAWEESSIDAATRAVYENTVNFNKFIEFCAISEFCYLEENGTEMVYEGTTLSGFFEAARNFFKSIWEKIQSIFKKALQQFNAWFMEDKKFIKKYEKQLQSVSNNSMEFGDKEIDVYEYLFYDHASKTDNIFKLDSIFGAGGNAEKHNITANGYVDWAARITNKESKKSSAEDLKEIKENLTTDVINDELDKFRGFIIDKISGVSNTGEVDSSSFVTEVKNVLMGNDGDKENVKMSDIVPKCKNFLLNSKDVKSAIDKGLKDSKKIIDTSLKALKKEQKVLEKYSSYDFTKADTTGKIDDDEQHSSIKTNSNNEGGKIAGAYHSIVTSAIGYDKKVKDILVQYTGTALDCLKGCSRQSKAVIVKALNYKEPKNESGFIQTESGSLLDSLRFI